jgi:CubicO group peptidase (beta-lactamase class C family)
MQWRLLVVALTGVLASAACKHTATSGSTSADSYTIPPSVDDGWPTASLEQSGIDRARIEAMTSAIHSHPEFNVHAVLIEHDRHLVYEQYFSGPDESWGRPLGRVTFTRETLHDLRSVTKSVVSALVGMANSSGAIPSLDAPLLDYFPEYSDLAAPERQRITIRHALMMGAGFEWHEDIPYNDPKNDEIVMTRSPEPIRYVLSRPIIAAPGTTWRYNGGTTQVLGTIVQRAVKQPLVDYAKAMLFDPLGITDFEWLGSLGGVPAAASGLRLRPRDLAKFGSVYLNDGQWNGRTIVPQDWVRESTRRRMTFPAQKARGYAYQWWQACYTTPSGVLEVPTAVGNGMQRIFLLRAHKAAVTVLSGRYNDFRTNPPERLLLEFIIPALPKVAPSPCPS